MLAHREELLRMIRDNVPGLKWIEDKLGGLLDQFFSDNADTQPPTYVPSPKHDPNSAQRGEKGSEMDLTDKEAQAVLDDAIRSGKKILRVQRRQGIRVPAR